MGYKWVTLDGADGERSYKVSVGSDELWVSNGSGNSIGKARSLDDAIALMKADYGKKVWNVDIGGEVTGCFPASTLIFTPFGWRRISELGRGEKIISFNHKTSMLELGTVTKRLDHSRSQIWEVHTAANQTPVRTTAIHPFLTTRGWIQAHLLRVGDDLIQAESSAIRVVTITAVVQTCSFEPVYNLFTSGAHNFIADGFVVHNFAYARFARTLWHRLFVDPRVVDLVPQPFRVSSVFNMRRT